ncbi:aflatoxin biosynthesis ketoreductase nor-1 [Lecanosticta acicola]|uniref:Aflatoxin biosynthesis ketoreductase nor-1 n=1 Tax=Lecanosticta acicola TaxID=111012 RepID=A0AAI9EFG1_9PEZI|nr:aflatoxin biosynthesis ketoreductase nor-1 [Lecanosticta acicola]
MPAASTNNGIIDGFQPEKTASGPTTYLVTGANRGLGRGMVAELLLRPNSLVVACVRDPNNESSTSLSELPTSESTSLIVLKLDCEVSEDPAAVVDALTSEHRVTSIDVVIANAAIASDYGPTSTITVEALEKHMKVNTYSVLRLFHATKDLLQKAATGNPRFVLIGAPISTITKMEECARAPLGAYGMSKLAACYLVRKFHFENKWLISFVVDPGHVQTDMGDQGARLMGRKSAPTTVSDSVRGVFARIDEATKEKSSGHFLLHEDGSDVAW